MCMVCFTASKATPVVSQQEKFSADESLSCAYKSLSLALRLGRTISAHYAIETHQLSSFRVSMSNFA